MKIMGILNVTPDSFSDGGLHFSMQSALGQVDLMVDEGVDIIDIGGESTRPYAVPVSLEEELQRVIPVITAIRKKYTTSISIDTTKAEVARQAMEAGADILNDVSSLQQDPEMLPFVQASSFPLIIMHMKGSPGTMQDHPEYDDVVADVIAFFQEKLQWLRDNGVDLQRVTIDPGIGFGKKLEHNLSLIKHLSQLKELGQPVVLGHSRKRFIGDLTGLEVEQRDVATAAISALAVADKIDILRVHNVGASRSAITVAQAIHNAQ